ncbi:MAG: hypothetical protein MUC99_03150 [Anaerolineae bacterium]|jgi:hypothetical protein|nr:hypothetical protein [Anaerolineae bacterium]
MKNITPKRAITRRAHQFIVFGGAGLAFGIFLVTVAQVLGRLPLAAPGSQAAATLDFISSTFTPIGVIVGLLGAAAVVRGLTFRRDNPLAQVVAERMMPVVDDSYTFVRNVNKLRFYVDGVLVGPPGVLVFRIVERGGKLLMHEGDRWLKPSPDGGWLPAGFDATRDCIADMKAIKAYLAQNGVQTEAIFGVVVLTKPTRIEEKLPKLPSATLETLLERLRAGYMAKPRIDPATAAAIVNHLRN